MVNPVDNVINDMKKRNKIKRDQSVQSTSP